MAETLFFFGNGSNGPTIWQSDSSGFKPISSSPSAVVNNWITPGPPVYAPPPILLCAGNPVNHIYAPSESGKLLV